MRNRIMTFLMACCMSTMMVHATVTDSDRGLTSTIIG